MKNLIKKLNSIKVEPEELFDILTDLDNPEEMKKFNRLTPPGYVIMRYPNDLDKAQAVYTRLHLLMGMIYLDTKHEWSTQNSSTKRRSVNYELIIAAAEEPLIEGTREPAFNVESFFARVKNYTINS